ncbi:IS30 family transposase [uncultured Desulfovibrio sp.]|uniref:IS30 family transposase n=1 Tax=uncultured Desulfovibrio sp. TaxID=167968 RepID=UPI0026181980|nr:IS30 family transposase [uncultured Desulfovibrio sp.]
MKTAVPPSARESWRTFTCKICPDHAEGGAYAGIGLQALEMLTKTVDCKLKGNRGLAKKRTPHDSCFVNKHLITAVERKSGFLMATYSADRSSTVVAAGIKQLFSRVPAWFFKSITYDQGREFFNDKRMDHHFGTASSFRHAGCPGERGLNERTNGLLRQFFPRT